MNQQFEETTALVVNTALNDMIQKGWVDICTIRTLLKVIGMVPPQKEFELLQALHCVNFGVMPDDLKQRIPGLITACFNGYVMPEINVVSTETPKRLGTSMLPVKF